MIITKNIACEAAREQFRLLFQTMAASMNKWHLYAVRGGVEIGPAGSSMVILVDNVHAKTEQQAVNCLCHYLDREGTPLLWTHEEGPDLSFAQLPTTLPINRRPLIITAPGDYRTRDGRRVTINEITPYAPAPNSGFLRHEVTAFEAKGSVWKMFRGKLRPRGHATWHLSGACRGLTEYPLDIVGRWED